MHEPTAGRDDRRPQQSPDGPNPETSAPRRSVHQALLAFVMIRLAAALLAGLVVVGASMVLVAAAALGTAIIIGLPIILVGIFVWLLADFASGPHDR